MSEGRVCCFTGHREIENDDSVRLTELVGDAIDKLAVSGVTVFRAGGAVGFDTLAALKVIEKKRTHPEIKLHLFLPCKDQTSRWNGYNVMAYEYVLKNADEITYTAEKYTRGCMLHRDRKMVEGSDYCVAFCKKSEGGTAYTLKYAKDHGLRVINIAKMML